MCTIKRREFLKGAAYCAGYVSAANLLGPLHTGVAWAASSCTASNKIYVHIFLDGGMDSSNFLVPRNLQSYFDKRPTIAINNPLVIDSRYGLNPNLTNIHALLLQGKAAVVNKVGYPNPTYSHDESKGVYSKAVRGDNVTTGWAGRFGDVYCSTAGNISSVLSFRGNTKDIAATHFAATTLGSLSNFRYNNDSDTNDSIYRREIMAAQRRSTSGLGAQATNLDTAWNVTDDAVVAMAQANSSYTSPITYPNTNLAQRLRDTAKLIKSNQNPSIILLAQGGYDTHGDEVASQTNLFTELDRAISAFWADLENMGKAQDVLIQVFTEFGRNTIENATNGTDHGHGTAVLTVGNNINGGVFGPDYLSTDYSVRDDLPGDVDFRELLAQVIERHLGVDSSPIFPESFVRTGVNIVK